MDQERYGSSAKSLAKEGGNVSEYFLS